MELGTVTSSEIIENKDDESKTLLLQVSISDDDDVQTAELLTTSGEDTRPIDGGAVAFILSIGEAYKLAIAMDDGIEPTVEKGEKEFYSIDPLTGLKKSFLKFLNDGNIQINGKNDNAVRFAELETAFNLLRTEFNALITVFNANVIIFNAHTHFTNPPSANITGVPIAPFENPGTPAIAEMSAAKVNNIQVADVSEDL